MLAAGCPAWVGCPHGGGRGFVAVGGGWDTEAMANTQNAAVLSVSDPLPAAAEVSGTRGTGPGGAAGARGAPGRRVPRRPVRGDRGARRRRPAGPGGAAHRLGKVGGVLRRLAAAAAPRRRTHADRLAAAGADARPGGRGGAGRRPGRGDQLGQPAGVGHRPRAARRRRGRRAAGLAGAAQQPALPREPAAGADPPDRAAGDRRGPLHLRLGPRLPARLPADRGPDHRSCRTPCPCSPPRPPPTPGWSTTSRNSCGDGRADHPRRPGPRVAAARRARRCRTPATGSAGCSPTWRTCPAAASSTP